MRIGWIVPIRGDLMVKDQMKQTRLLDLFRSEPKRTTNLCDEPPPPLALPLRLPRHRPRSVLRLSNRF